jgi:hypothetical protein
MRHATPDDLEQLGDLLEDLRALPAVVERRPGTFYLRSRALFHFHHDPSGMYVDARLGDGDFERQRVTTAKEQAQFLRQVRRALRQRAPAGEGTLP